MASPKARIFIGSSTEAKRWAMVLCDELTDVADVIGWWDAPEFSESFTTIQALLSAPELYDYAIFLLTPDDVLESRGQRGYSTRDNVLFEYGLFLSVLGPRYVLAYRGVGRDREPKIPSDLLGVNMPTFPIRKRHQGLPDLVTGARKKIRNTGLRPLNLKLVNQWGFSDEDRARFGIVIERDRLQAYEQLWRDNALLLAVRRKDRRTSAHKAAVRVSQPFVVDRPYSEGIALEVKVLRPRDGAEYEGHVFAVPTTFDAKGVRTMRQIVLRGGREIQAPKTQTFRL